MKDFKAYPLKAVEVIDDYTLLLRFYLQFADWETSNDVLEIKIKSRHSVLQYVKKLENLIGVAIFIYQKDGTLELWEGEYLEECSTDTTIPFESYERQIVPKSLEEWKQQYLALVDEYYKYRRATEK